MKFRQMIAVTGLAISLSPALALPIEVPAPRQHLECVPFARQTSGIQIYGDARTWWDQAEGKYRRGERPRLGAVLAFRPYGAMQLGHVATVSEIVNARTIRVTHANWSPIDGERGQIERNVDVIDVSEAGDWSAVRVWYAPLQDLGTTAWPTYGFIYPGIAGIAVSPKLQYASVTNFEPRRANPTNRLSYLAKLLPRLRDTSAKAF
jgi:surface antigen